MSDDTKKTSQLEKEFRQLVIDELKSISNKQEDTSSSVNDMFTEFKIHKKESELRWEAIQQLDKEQNDLLAEHHARSTAIQRDVELREQALRNELFGEKGLTKRIDKLEEPRIVRRALVKIVITLGSVSGAVYAIGKLLGWF